jgi:predicted NBD/HSP70 family sugar kinase
MVHRAGVSQDELRRLNVSALLSWVHAHGPTSRAVLTAQLGLNRSTIGDLTAQLEALGLVSEEAPATAGRTGRPSLVVTPRHEVNVVAVALDVDRITGALVGLGGVELQRRTRLHQRGEHDVSHVVESVAQLVRELLHHPLAGRCQGIGVSVPGAVRFSDGLVRSAPNLGWKNEPFADLLSDALDLPVVAGNDADLGVLSEHVRGAAVGVNDVGYVTGSVGIGGGFLVGGVPLRGSEGYAGEVGHLLVDGNGPRCRCGGVGCWETKVGESYLLTAAGRLPGGGPTAVAEVIDAADAGDQRAAASLEAVAEWLGVGLRAVVNVFNPEVIVLGGLLARTWRARAGLVDAALDRGGLIAPRDRVTIRPAVLGDDSPLLGAAELAFADLLADPLAAVRSEMAVRSR